MGFTNFDKVKASLVQADQFIGGGIAGMNPFARIFYVDSVHGGASKSGETPDMPLSTIKLAIAKCVAGRGDYVFVAPGHTETLTGATGMLLNVSGITIVGFGNGTHRPQITFGAAAATIPVSAANISIFNIVFKANFADVASYFTLTTAPGFSVKKCEFLDTSSILNALTVITTTVSVVADNLTFEGNRVVDLGTTAATTAIKIAGTHDRLKIVDNYFHRAALSNTAVVLAHGALVVTNLEMAWNTVYSLTTDTSTGGILITTTSTTNTGHVHDNRIKTLDVAGMLIITTGSKYGFSENYISGTADTSGILIPAADSDGS